MDKKETFYLNLRKKILVWVESRGFKNRKIVEYILAAPDFFYLLWKLSLDPDIPAEDRILVGFALLYFISPFDFLPEGIIGPIGYLDDIALSAYVIKKVIKSAGEEKVKKYWPGEEDLVITIEKIISKVDEYLGSGLWERIVRFVDTKAAEQKKDNNQTETKKSNNKKKKTVKKALPKKNIKKRNGKKEEK
jgi:uncharacterized membrane protein YkvA (DUF1232 family)